MNTSNMTQQAYHTNGHYSRSLLEHWQGHRRLTRRVIEAFPEDKLFSYSFGGMRPYRHQWLWNSWEWRYPVLMELLPASGRKQRYASPIRRVLSPTQERITGTMG